MLARECSRKNCKNRIFTMDQHEDDNVCSECREKIQTIPRIKGRGKKEKENEKKI